MNISELEINEVVGSVWDTMLGGGICPALPSDSLLGCQPSRTGIVRFAGAWQGAIACSASVDLQRQAAATLFEIPASELTHELMDDALGEITNMIGGNLKALLPAPSHLSLPAVLDTGEALTRHLPARTAMAAFIVSGQPFVVHVQSDEIPHAGGE